MGDANALAWNTSPPLVNELPYSSLAVILNDTATLLVAKDSVAPKAFDVVAHGDPITAVLW